MNSGKLSIWILVIGLVVGAALAGGLYLKSNLLTNTYEEGEISALLAQGAALKTAIHRYNKTYHRPLSSLVEIYATETLLEPLKPAKNLLQNPVESWKLQSVLFNDSAHQLPMLVLAGLTLEATNQIQKQLDQHLPSTTFSINGVKDQGDRGKISSDDMSRVSVKYTAAHGTSHTFTAEDYISRARQYPRTIEQFGTAAAEYFSNNDVMEFKDADEFVSRKTVGGLNRFLDIDEVNPNIRFYINDLLVRNPFEPISRRQIIYPASTLVTNPAGKAPDYTIIQASHYDFNPPGAFAMLLREPNKPAKTGSLFIYLD